VPRLVYLDDARNDLVDIGDSVTARSGSARALWLLDALRARCRAAAAVSSQIGRPRDKFQPGLRSIPHKGYLIFIRYRDDALEVVAIIHGARDLEAVFEDRFDADEDDIGDDD